MPELPEVETTRRGISRLISGKQIAEVTIHNARLRWPVPTRQLQQQLPGSSFKDVQRRAKYLLLDTGHGHVIMHLGMSGSLRVLDANTPLEKHDHVEICFTNRQSLRLRDPRRFGAVLWTADDPHHHPLIAPLGPEPLDIGFTAEYLFHATRKRRVAIKNLIMDARQVVGVGNIYACESLFMAGIRPGKAAGRLSRNECTRLVDEIRQVLSDAIKAGGTTLRDFSGTDGQPGYFSQSLFVYGRESEPCLQCGSPVKRRIIGQRSTFYCPVCQQ